MSRSPYFYLERYDKKKGKYQLYHPFVPRLYRGDNEDNLIEADLFPFNATHDLFSIIEQDSEITIPHLPPMQGIHEGLPQDCSDFVRKQYEDCSYENFNGTTHSPNTYYFTYADMLIYTLRYPECLDMETMDEDQTECAYMPNPMTLLMKRVEAFCNVLDSWGDWSEDYSYIRVICWIE